MPVAAPRHCLSFVCLTLLLWAQCLPACAAEPLQVLFLGDKGHHRPAARFEQLQPVLRQRGIQLKYTEDTDALNGDALAAHDAVLLYANIDNIAPAQADALLKYVADGGGFVPLHCATYCFRNDPRIVALMGAQFQRHGTGIFRTEIAATRHPVTAGFDGFSSWDETYVHHRHNTKDRTVLAYRVDQDGREPWTWIRTHGKGRVFYTAWGHDHRTWSHPGFHNLVERGIRWAAGADVDMVPDYRAEPAFDEVEIVGPESDGSEVSYTDVGAKIPNYPPSDRWGVQEKPLTEMQNPLSPAASMRHFAVPKGFAVQLYAAEPQLAGKPLAMNWDHRGRVWVCESYDYPNELQPVGNGRDRIRICEDTDGDGQADKFTVFAEQLSIPTAIAFYRGGAIVQNGVETLYLKDTDGDDVADVRKVLMSGWALGDTHGGVSNFRYGHDNWFWAMQGYNNSAPVIDGQRQQSFRMGFFRFRLDQQDPPNVTDLEFVRSTNNNTWGLGLTEDGLVTGSTANHNPSVYMPLANRYYERVLGWAPQQLGSMADTYKFKPITDRVRQVDQHGGYTAGAGHAVYTARSYPAAFWNRTAFVCGPTGHLVGTFVLRREGADMNSTSPFNLLASTDEWSAPIAAEVGPDGNVWVVDWYNFIIQHNPTPQGFKTGKGNAYESDLRDKKHGRIYRVAYQGGNAQHAQAQQWNSLAGASPHQLVQTLSHPTLTWRLHAQRLLVERGKRDVVPALLALTEDTQVDNTGLNAGALHAIWTLQGLGVWQDNAGLAEQRLLQLSSHPSAAVRRAAWLAIPLSTTSLDQLFTDASPLLDGDSQVRLGVLQALADCSRPHEGVWAALNQVAGREDYQADRWLSHALISAASTHGREHGWLLDGHGLAQASVVRQLAEHAARTQPKRDTLQTLLASAALVPPSLASAAVEGLSRGWGDVHRVQVDRHGEASLAALLTRVDAAAQGKLIRLAKSWGSREFEQLSAGIVTSLTEQVGDEALADAKRVEAARQLIQLRPEDGDVVAELLGVLGPQASPSLTAGLLQTLADSSAAQAGTMLVGKFGGLTPTARQLAVGVLLRRADTASDLLDGLASQSIQLADLSLEHRQSLTGHPDSNVRKRWASLLESSGQGANNDRARVVQAFADVAEQTGDVQRGRAVFEQQCAKCHIHGEIGTAIGPNLTGMSVHPKHELLVHILDPSRSVEGNFRQYTVVKTDGQVLSGMLAAESKTAIELVDTQAKRHAIARADIDELVGSTKSVMPEGFEQLLQRQQLIDLLEFLTAKGKFVPLPLDKWATAVSTKGMFSNGDNGPDRIVFESWGAKPFRGVPFYVADPQGGMRANVILLNGPLGPLPPKMPKRITLPVNTPVKRLHMLSGIGGWSYPYSRKETTSVTVRFHFADGKTQDTPLINGKHFADYIRREDVPDSQFAFAARGQQVRYLSIPVERAEPVTRIELIKGDDQTAPIIVALTLETP